MGTRGADTITGSSGADLIAGLEGNDTLNSGGGWAVVHGGEGNDTINVRMTGTLGPGDGDEVHCGPGKRDRVFYDRADTVAKDCEIRRPGQIPP